MAIVSDPYGLFSYYNLDLLKRYQPDISNEQFKHQLIINTPTYHIICL